ncbi:nuclear mitotic apparatus protein 1 isoform X1 [Stigmatopora argus]
MTPVNLGVKALVTWVNSIVLTDREINIEDLKDGDIILQVISRIKNEPFSSSIKTTEERFEQIAEFVQKDCRFSPTNDTSLSWENIKNGINLSVEIAKLLLLLVYHDMMNERSTLKTLECEVEREIANLTGSFIMESFGCVYLKSGLDTYLAKRHLSVHHETLDRTTSTSLSNTSTVSSLSDEDSPVFHLTPKVPFLDIHTVASSSVSKSPLQDIMNTPKFQLRKLQRQIIQEREYRDGLERELTTKISLITSKESHINRLEYNLGKMKVEQNNEEQNTKAKIDELESQIDSLQLRLSEILKEYKDFKSNSLLAERKVDELEEEKGILSSQMRAAYAQLSTSQTEVSGLKETLASCQEEWRTKIDYWNSELNQATSQKDVLTEQVQILQGKISCLEDDLKAARKEDVGENMGPVIERDELECEIVHLKSELENTVCCLKKAEANEEAKTRELSAYAQEITQHNQLLEQQNLHIETLVQSKADIMKELQKEISEQREALQKKIDHLQLQLDQAEQQKADQIQELMERQKALEKQVDLLVLEKERLVQTNQATERENLATLDREEVLKKELELLTREKAKLLKEMEKIEENERLKKQLQEQLSVKTEALEDYKAKVRAAYAQLSTSQTEVSRLKETLASCQEEWRTKIDYLNSELNQATSQKRDELECEIVLLKSELENTVCCLKKAEANEEAKTRELSAYAQEITQHNQLLEQQNLHIETLVQSKADLMKELQKEISEQREALQKKIDHLQLQLDQAEQQKAYQIQELMEKPKVLEKQVDLLVLEKERLVQTNQAAEKENLATLDREEVLKKELELLTREKAKLLKEMEKFEDNERLKKQLQDQLSVKTEAVEHYKAKKEILEHDIFRLKTELDSTVNCLKMIEANEEEKTHQLSFYEQEIIKQKNLLDQQSLNFQDLVRAKDLTMKNLQKEISEQREAFQKKIDHLQLQLDQAEQQKADQIQELMEKPKVLEKQVDLLVMEKERLVQTYQAAERENLDTLDREEVLKKELELLTREKAKLLKEMEKFEDNERLKKQLQDQLSVKTEAVEHYKAKKEILEHDIFRLKTELDSTVNCLKMIEANEEEKTHQLSFYEQEIAKQKNLLDQQSLNFQDLVRAKDLTMKELQKEMSEQSSAFQKKIDQLELAEQHKADQIIVLEGEKKKALEKRVAMLILERDRLFETKQATDSEHLASLEQEKNLKKELESLKQEQAIHNEESDKLRRDLLEQLSARTEAVEDYKAERENLQCEIVQLKNQLDKTVGCLTKAAANEEAKKLKLSSYEEEIAQQKKLLALENLHTDEIVQSKDHIIKRLEEDISQQREALQKKIDHLKLQFEQAEKQKADEISVLQEEQKALEKQVDMLVVEKEKLFQTKQATERENMASLKMEEVLKKELELLKLEKATLLKEKEKEQASERLKIELQEQLFAKSEAVQHYKAQVEKAVSHYNDKKQLLHDSQEEVANLKHSLEVREKEVKAASLENKLLQMELEKAQGKEKNLLSTLARLEAQVAYADLNLRAQNQIPGHEGGVSELCHTKIEPKRSMSSDSLDRSSLEESLNNTRKLSAPDESSTPLIRSSERLAAKRSALKDESFESLYFTPINTRHRTNAENKTEMDCAFVNPSSSVKRRRTTQVINITLTKKTPRGGEDDETFYSLASARSQLNLSSATGVRPISMELFETPGRMTAAGSDQLSGLPGYRRSTLHSQTGSTFCVGAENEPDGASDDWMRIAELQARNKACLPHLKSSYPVEFENGSKSTVLFTDEEVRTGDPTETIRRASLMPGQLQRSVAAHRHSLAAPQSTVSTRSHRLSLMADHRPSKLVSSSQLRSPRCQKQSAFTLSVPLTSPEKKIKGSCFPRPLTPKNKNSNTRSSSSQLHAALSPADRRQSMVFTIDNTPKSNRSNYLKKGLSKLRSSTRKSPGKTPKRPPVNSATKENMPSATSIVAPGRGGKSKSFKSPQVKDNRMSAKPGGKTAKSPRLTASARKIKT